MSPNSCCHVDGTTPGVQVAGGGRVEPVAWNPLATSPQDTVNGSATGSLVKRLVEVAKREAALFDALSTACARNDRKAIIAAARSIVAHRGQSEEAEPHHCAA